MRRKEKSMEIRSAAVVCVGTELLLGNILDTNSRYIASRLCETGIPLYRKFTVGDNPERMKETFAQALGCNFFSRMITENLSRYTDITIE